MPGRLRIGVLAWPQQTGTPGGRGLSYGSEGLHLRGMERILYAGSPLPFWRSLSILRQSKIHFTVSPP